ncbi:MAG TPA: flippase, partial [Actinomycetota bacterium]|nr:flippase [Actinomycetota bacterium]
DSPDERAAAPVEDGARSLAGNSLWALTAQAVSKVASVVFVAAMARALSKVDYGYFNLALSLVPLFLIFGIWSLDAVVIKEIARNPTRTATVFASGLVARAGLGALALGMAVLVTPFFVDGMTPVLAIALVGAALFLDQIAEFIGAVFRGLERMSLYGIVIMANRIVSTAITLVVLARGGTLVAASSAYLVGSLIALAFAWILLLRITPIHRTDVSSNETKRLVREGLPLGVSDVLNMAILRLDSVLLYLLRGPVSVAVYGVAYRLFESLLFVAWSMATAALPRIARAHTPADSARTYDLLLTATLTIYVPAAAITPFAGSWLVTTVFSDRYLPSAEALTWLMLALVLYGFGHMARVAAIGIGRGREIARVAGASLAVNIVANLTLIPRFGFVGAAMATTITEGCQAVALGTLFYRATATRPSVKILMPLAAGAATAGVLTALNAAGFAAIVIGMGTYAITLLGISAVLAPELGASLLRLIMKRRVGHGSS